MFGLVAMCLSLRLVCRAQGGAPATSRSAPPDLGVRGTARHRDPSAAAGVTDGVDDATSRRLYDAGMDSRDTSRIEEFIKGLGQEELLYLNRLIVERLKLLSQARSTVAMARFNIGEMVRFDAGDGRTITGRIIRLNKKTISILTHDHQRWNVAPVFLERAKDE